jgi:hypothetical protein
MSDPNENAIIVRVDVKVPLPAVRELRRRKRMLAAIISITEPPPPDGAHPQGLRRRVRDDGTGNNTGFICARGTVSGTAQHIVARVFSGGQAPPAVPNPCDPLLRCAVITGTNWDFSHLNNNELPGAAWDNTAGGAPNNLAVWVLSDGCYQLNSRLFCGGQSSTTECQASGSGSGFFNLAAQAEGQLPETLTATVTHKTGAFAELPERVVLVKEKGRQQWAWRCSRVPGREIVLVQDEQDGLHVYRLKGASYDPPLVRPARGSSLSPPHLRFEVRGRATPPEAQGSFTVTITE